MRAKTWVPAGLFLAVAACTGCGDESDAGAPEFDYSAERAVPAVSAYADDSSDTEPSADSGVVELELDNGATLALWIDPDDKRTVYQQHSDPADPQAWTAPEVLYEAGDGCLFIDAATNGEVVAATLGCYEDDAFLQQAPDRGQAVVTEDLETWHVEDRGEFFAEPRVADDGEVTWVDG